MIGYYDCAWTVTMGMGRSVYDGMGYYDMCVSIGYYDCAWWVTISVNDGLLIWSVCDIGYWFIWVLRACANFIRGCHVFLQLLVTVENDDVSTELI